MPQFSLFKSQLLYGSFKPQGIIFEQAKRIFNLKTPQSVENAISTTSFPSLQQEVPVTVYTYSTLIQCATCQSTASCFNVQICTIRNNIKKKELKEFLQQYHYEQIGGDSSDMNFTEIRFILNNSQSNVAKVSNSLITALNIDRFFILPNSYLKEQEIQIEKLHQPIESFYFDKLRCNNCKKNLGYLFNSKNEQKTISSSLAFLNLDRIYVQDQLSKEQVDKLTNEQIKSIKIRIDAAWYNVGLAYSSVAISSKQLTSQLEGFKRELSYQVGKMKSKVNNYSESQNIVGLQM